ncbi:Calsyntenin-3 [Saguinus oedipus]|uniref:Calsyntenin-3 n=1 Tax=Saguinus oedipus TaxID=9490 RepID=A0ABQ9UYK4_SAGOE|nr:Calsyntenin-3 [Saguinus oedipus]
MGVPYRGCTSVCRIEAVPRCTVLRLYLSVLHGGYSSVYRVYSCTEVLAQCTEATVHVRVNDVNEFAPVFVERLYRAAVTEGKLYDRILRVEAVDGDCSPQYSQICYYEILTPNTPFLIDNDGNIENTEKLQYSGERLYKFTVTAYDCGKKRAADDAEVEIQVKPTCKPSWQGWNKRIEYAPGAGSLALFPGIRLETCDEPLWNIQATIELQTSHVAKGCDRDNYSERALRKLCGACAPSTA